MKYPITNPLHPSPRLRRIVPGVLASLATLAFLTARPASAADPALEKKVLDLFEKKCADCHSEGDEEPALTGQINLGELIANVDYVNKTDVDAGELMRRVLLPANSPKRMPKSKGEPGEDRYIAPLTSEEIDLMRTWIGSEGAKPSTPTPTPTVADKGKPTSPATPDSRGQAGATPAAPASGGTPASPAVGGTPPNMAVTPANPGPTVAVTPAAPANPGAPAKGASPAAPVTPDARGPVKVVEVPAKGGDAPKAGGSTPQPGPQPQTTPQPQPQGQATLVTMKTEVPGTPPGAPADGPSTVTIEVPRPQGDAPLEDRVKFVFEEKCAECHRTKKKPLLHKDVDLASLLASKYVEIGEPEKSVLFQVVDHGDESPDRMPESYGKPGDEDYRAPLTSEEKDLFRQWIDGQSTKSAAREFVTMEQMLKDIHEDLESQPESRQPFLRYLTLGNLYNINKDGTPVEADAQMDTYRAGMSKMLNCLSYSAKITVPEPIDEARTCYRIDIRDYTMKPEMWEKIANHYPYGLKGVSARFENRIKDMTKSEQAYMRADWFTFATSQPPLYHDILELPDTEQAFEKKFGIDTLENLRKRQAVRASFFPSGVSMTNRLIERHDLGTYTGGYWKSYDFTRNHAGDKQDLTLAPLGPKEAKLTEDTDLMFNHDGGEIVFHLPNGLMGGYLATAAGKRLNRAPIEIVQDKTGFREDGIVLNGISCIACHKRGLNSPPSQSLETIADQLGRRGESLGNFADQSAIKKLYPEADVLRAVVKQDVDRFEEAMKQCAPGYAGDEPVGILYRRFLKDIQANQFVTEFWTDEKTLNETLGESENRALHVMAKKLEDGVPFTRDTFLRHFEDCAEELGYTLKPFANLAYEEFGGEAVLGKTEEVAKKKDDHEEVKEKGKGDSDEAKLTDGSKVTITMDSLTYKVGDGLGFSLKSDCDCFVRVIQFGADGSTTQLVPNKLEKDNKLTAGKERSFPGSTDSGKKYVMQTSEPIGAETVVMLVSKSQFRDADNMKFDADSDAFRALKRGGVINSRGAIIIKAGDKKDDDHDTEVSKASVGYVLEKK